MKTSARCAAPAFVLALSVSSIGCSKKGSECQSLIGSMNELGRKLSETQKVTGNSDAKPEQVAAALRPFALAAKTTGDKLAAGELTVTELKKTAGDAARASLALASSSTSMAEAAEQMRGLDAAGKVVEDQKRVVDAAEAEIKRLCDANAKLCINLAKVLVTFPPPPEKTDNLAATSAWAGKLSTWTAELAKVDVTDAALKTQIVTFEGGWKSFAAAMTTLVGISETAKRYDDFAKEFNANIDLANKAIGEANSLCKG